MDTEHTVMQLKMWFATFSVSRSIRCDNGPPFFSRGFKEFCDKYCIRLDLTSPYNPESSGEVLPYYMEAVKRGWVGTRQRGPRSEPDGEEVPGEYSDRHFDHPEEHSSSREDSGEGSAGVPYVEQ